MIVKKSDKIIDTSLTYRLLLNIATRHEKSRRVILYWMMIFEKIVNKEEHHYVDDRI